MPDLEVLPLHQAQGVPDGGVHGGVSGGHPTQSGPTTEVAAAEQLQHSVSYFDFYLFIKMSARDLHIMKIGKPYN